MTTTQYSSSWGGCSAIRLSEKDSITNFIIANYDQLKIEAAKGHGENITAIGLLYECFSSSSEDLDKELKMNFEKVFKSNDPEKIYYNIKNLIRDNPVLKQNCKQRPL